MNRIEQLSFSRKCLLFLCVVLAIILILELGTFAVVFSFYATGLTEGSTYKEYKENFHPLFTGKPLGPSLTPQENMTLYDWNEYDPWYGYRNSYKLKQGIYGTDIMGFISDGNPERDITFKPKNVFRIFILGGSTVAGHGSSSPDKTISAQLEKYLNLQKPKDLKYTFQVINAGVAGYYSPMELAYLEFEIVYYQPDMIIVFNGYNDFLTLSKNRKIGQNSKLERYHWSDYHKYLKTYIDNQNSTFKLQLPEKLQLWRYFYSIDAFIRFISAIIQNEREELPNIILRNYPTITKEDFRPIWESTTLDYINWLTDEQIKYLPGDINDYQISHYVNNVVIMRLICESKNISFLLFLQPMLSPEFKEVLFPVEKLFYDSLMQSYAQNYHVNYQKMLHKFSQESHKKLNRSLGDSSFIDLTRFFYGINQQTYIDWAHYNDFGNLIISKHIAAIVLDKMKASVR